MGMGDTDSADSYIVLKGFMVGLFVFIAVAIIVFERWLYVKCRQTKYKKRGILTKGFVNMVKTSEMISNSL